MIPQGDLMNRFLVVALSLLFSSSWVHAARVHVQRMQEGGVGGPQNAGRSEPSPAPVAHESNVRVERRDPVAVQAPRTAGRTYVMPRVNNRVHVQRAAPVHVVPRTGGNWYRGGGRPYTYRYYRGHPWYGYYRGSDFYWTRWHANNWWWYNSHYNRWSVWWNGYWWWSEPGGVTYVYLNNQYYPYAPGVVQVAPPPVMAAPTESEIPDSSDESAAQSLKSPDGKRMVQISGPENEAFLYDTSSSSPRFMRFLAKNVDRVRFSGGKIGQPLQILIDFKGDSRFTVYDAEGIPAEKTEAIPEPPAPLPD